MKKDPMGYSFSLFQELGYDIDIIYASRSKEPSTEIKTYDFSHSKNDGLTGFISLLKNNKNISNIQIPPLRKETEYSYFKNAYLNFYHFFRTLFQFNKKSLTWGKQHPQKKENTFQFDWVFYNQEQTSKIRDNAQKNNTSTNSYLLFNLNKIIQPYLKKDDLPSTWIVPINLHSKLTKDTVVGNNTSIMELEIVKKDTVNTIHKKIHNEIKIESYRGPLIGTTLNNMLGPRFTKWLLKNTVASKKRVGTFSNIGKWYFDDNNTNIQYAVVPPVHPGQPFGVGAITCNERLSIGIKIDSSLIIDKNEIREIIQNFTDSIL